MNYYNFDITRLQPTALSNIWHEATDILINNDNLKPDWVQVPAEFTEFYIKRSKKNLLIVIGESWTYGEALEKRGTPEKIATGIGQFSFDIQLTYSLGPRMATSLDCDLYQYAVPGNCNMYMFFSLERILKHVEKMDYEKIYISMQMTEPGREMGIIYKLPDHPLHNLYFDKNTINIVDWIKNYDEIFFDLYKHTLDKFKHLNIDAILWKNFCRFVSNRRDYPFKFIEKSWIQYSGKVLNKDLEMPDFYSIGWFDNLIKDYGNIKINHSWVNRQFDIIEASNNFIKGNPLHNNHPNEFGHLLWSQYLLRSAGWKNDI